MAERRLRFRKNEPPRSTEKEPEAVVPPPVPMPDAAELNAHINRLAEENGLEGSLTRLLGDGEAARRMISRAMELRQRHSDPNPQNLPRVQPDPTPTSTVTPPNRRGRHPVEWYIPNISDDDFVDIWMDGEPVVSGLLRREAERLINAHNRALRHLMVPATTATSPTTPPQSARPGGAEAVDISVENLYQDINSLFGTRQRIVTGAPRITIQVNGSGDPSAILEDAIRQISEHTARVAYNVRG